MKAFIAVSCLLAVASAQYHHQPQAQHAGPTGGWQGPLHIPVLDANGVPQEPAAVVQARNEHLANFGVAPQQQQQYQYQQQPQYQQYQQPQYQSQYQSQYQPQYQSQYQPQYQSQQYQQPQEVAQAVLGPDGHPQDAPDVAAAKAAHFAAYAEAHARNTVAAPESRQYNPAPQQYNHIPQQYNPAPQFTQHYAPVPQHYNPAPVHTAAAGPIDTPEVAAAKAAHFAAHAKIATPSPQNHY